MKSLINLPRTRTSDFEKRPTLERIVVEPRYLSSLGAPALCYRPGGYSPAPWALLAWHDRANGADVLDFRAHPELSAFNATVYWRAKHDRDQEHFRTAGIALRWDDKMEYRISRRYRELRGCFLIDVFFGTPESSSLSFYHEPQLLPKLPELPAAHVAPKEEDPLDRIIGRTEAFNADRKRVWESALSDAQKARVTEEIDHLEEELLQQALEDWNEASKR